MRRATGCSPGGFSAVYLFITGYSGWLNPSDWQERRAPASFTRFSTSGGGQLPGFEEGLPGQYRIDQWLFEGAAKYNGFSWHQEFHWKQVQDKEDNTDTLLYGNFFQLGYFFHHWRESSRARLQWDVSF